MDWQRKWALRAMFLACACSVLAGMASNGWAASKEVGVLGTIFPTLRKPFQLQSVLHY